MSIANVRKIRELKGYSQEYMAHCLGVSQKTYSRVEAGHTKIDLERLQHISKILDIDVITLLSFDEKSVLNRQHNIDKDKLSLSSDGFETERNAYLKHIQHLEKENAFLKKQLDKLIE